MRGFVSPVLKQMQAEEPAEFQIEWRSVQELLEHYQQVKLRHPALADRLLLAIKLEDQVQQLAERIVETRVPAQKELLGQELRSKLRQIFDIKLQEKAMEVELLEEEINAFKAMIERRKKLKEQIIERRYREIIGASSEETSWW